MFKMTRIKTTLYMLTCTFMTASCGDSPSTTASTADQQNRLDLSGNGICEGDLGLRPPATDPERRVSTAPTLLQLDLRLAEGITAPRAPRLAVYYEYMPSGVGASSEPYELFAFDLAEQPNTFSITLEGPTKEMRLLQERIANDINEEPMNKERGNTVAASEINLSTSLVIYDDVNGDERIGLGQNYTNAEIPDENAGEAAWDAYIQKIMDFDEAYGQLSFIGLSSPTDKRNEVLAIVPLELRFGTDSRGDEGYLLYANSTVCDELAPDTGRTCKICTTETTDASFDAVHVVVVDWSIPE